MKLWENRRSVVEAPTNPVAAWGGSWQPVENPSHAVLAATPALTAVWGDAWEAAGEQEVLPKRLNPFAGEII